MKEMVCYITWTCGNKWCNFFENEGKDFYFIILGS